MILRIRDSIGRLLFKKKSATAYIAVMTIEGYVLELIPLEEDSPYKGMVLVRTVAPELAVFDDYDHVAIKSQAELLGYEMCPEDLLKIVAEHHKTHPSDYPGGMYDNLDTSFYLLIRNPEFADAKSAA